MDNTELFGNLKSLVHVDLNQYPNNTKNKFLNSYNVGYHDAQRKLYNDLLILTKKIDQERIVLRMIDDAVAYINQLNKCQIYKQNLHSKQPWLLKDETSNLAVFHTNEEIIDIAKSKGWNAPDLIPEGFE